MAGSMQSAPTLDPGALSRQSRLDTLPATSHRTPAASARRLLCHALAVLFTRYRPNHTFTSHEDLNRILGDRVCHVIVRGGYGGLH